MVGSQLGDTRHGARAGMQGPRGTAAEHADRTGPAIAQRGDARRHNGRGWPPDPRVAIARQPEALGGSLVPADQGDTDVTGGRENGKHMTSQLKMAALSLSSTPHLPYLVMSPSVNRGGARCAPASAQTGCGQE